MRVVPCVYCRDALPLMPSFRHQDVIYDPPRAKEGLELKEKHIRRLLGQLARARARIKSHPVRVTCPATQDNIAVLYRSVDQQVRELFKDSPKKMAFWRDQLNNAESAAATNGRRFGHRYSDETIVMCLMLRAKSGNKAYEDLREWLCLPSQRLLDSKKPVTPADGVNPEALRAMRSVGEKRGMETVNMGCLSFDSCKIKSGLVWNAHSGRLIGLASDAFNQDIIQSQFLVRACRSVCGFVLDSTYGRWFVHWSNQNEMR